MYHFPAKTYLMAGIPLGRIYRWKTGHPLRASSVLCQRAFMLQVYKEMEGFISRSLSLLWSGLWCYFSRTHVSITRGSFQLKLGT